MKPISHPLWYALWTAQFPNIVIQKPKSDLCVTCQQNIMSLSKLHGLSEAEKESKLRESLQHLTLVQQKRKFYNDLINECVTEIQNDPHYASTLQQYQPCSFPGKMHYSFDFAQQISLPFSSQQVGPIYFLSGFKIGLFGIALEPVKKNSFYTSFQNRATSARVQILRFRCWIIV